MTASILALSSVGGLKKEWRPTPSFRRWITQIEREIQHGEGSASSLDGAGEGHLGDVDPGVAEELAYATDDAGAVVVLHEEERSFGIGFHAVAVDADDAGLATEDRACGAGVFFGITGGDYDEIGECLGSGTRDSVRVRPRLEATSGAFMVFTLASAQVASRKPFSAEREMRVVSRSLTLPL